MAGGWERVAELFHGALERPAAERDGWLRDACRDDSELRAEVADLLAAHQAADEGGFLPAEGSILPATALDVEPEVAAARVGQRVGAWRIVRHLGAGGMGEVYLAERADGELDQRAAIKLIKRGMDSALIVRRFRAERQILAGLDHPYISRFLDGGATDDGRPYFAMEYIEGEPIDEHCRRTAASVPRRLELFLAVCDAVHHAHQRLVVHRDIKPRNVFVLADGTPKLLDFGLARFLGADGEATQTAALMMTPAYASPEQLNGAPVTTATDVHALGILLYELLAGRNPFLRRGDPLAMRRAILEEEPPPPSTVAEGERLRRQLRGDLDTIVATALRKDVARRYGSVDRLAADVRRHLRDEPVLARRDSLLYRASRFVRRHRLAVAAACGLVAILAGATALTLRQAAIAQRERDVATAERDRARAVGDFLVDLFESDPLADDPGDRDQLTLRQFLEQSEERVRRELGDRELRATLLSRLARVNADLGKLDRAKALAEEALALRRALGDRGSEELAIAYNSLATAQQDLGEYAPAEENFRRALAVREAVHGPDSEWVAEAANNLAVLISYARDGDPEVERLVRRSLELRRRIFGDASPDAAQSMNTLASFLYGRRGPGDVEEAVRWYRQSVAARERTIGPHHPLTALTRSNLGHALRELGQLAESEAELRAAIPDLTAALGADNPKLAGAWLGLHKTLLRLGRFDESHDALCRAMAIDDKTLPPDHPARNDTRELLVELSKRSGSERRCPR